MVVVLNKLKYKVFQIVLAHGKYRYILTINFDYYNIHSVGSIDLSIPLIKYLYLPYHIPEYYYIMFCQQCLVHFLKASALHLVAVFNMEKKMHLGGVNSLQRYLYLSPDSFLASNGIGA